MKKFFISLLSVGIFLGIFGEVGTNVSGSPNLLEETVQAEANNDKKTINYEVDKENSNEKSEVDPYFTKSAEIYTCNDGTYRLVLTVEVSQLTDLEVSKIDNQTPEESESYNKDGKEYLDISFKTNSLSQLNDDVTAVVKTKLLSIDMNQQTVDFKFDTSTMDSQETTNPFTDSMDSITESEDKKTTDTETEPEENKPDTNNNQDVVNNDDTETNSNEENEDSDIIQTPQEKTDSASNNETADTKPATQPKTVLKELTYKVAKNNGDGSLIASFFTNTAKLIKNPDGTYSVETTIKYPKEFGSKAFQINYINKQKPINLSFTNDEDNNYLKFDFPLNSLDDLGNPIAGNISINVPAFNLHKTVDFDLVFDSLNQNDISNLMHQSGVNDTSNIAANLGGLNKIGQSKSDKSNSANKTTNSKILPETGDEVDHLLMLIGGTILALWIILLKGTYLKR
ncbi:LPXTG cell wall anchor domain-containing protein [Companilactobacillus halodurans]|uniref:LPXTG cell wall anchor domain-containing protein n=1 Tax=Companilactobacillus halodurans TaxID=2584183 RepID=A0A5P0ZYU6_9LACO|nr:LPXTG cell wall anchor domain-containing protein [Companilactobacillus halodurans]MQS75296.1 LPXTG cell wall anchor domain-containing protein [Companilactobacillus halodurans]MQS98137.1 LPXTG cell wall anchor domain-containing protein [Companilactobacillus halodurans]